MSTHKPLVLALAPMFTRIDCSVCGGPAGDPAVLAVFRIDLAADAEDGEPLTARVCDRCAVAHDDGPALILAREAYTAQYDDEGAAAVVRRWLPPALLAQWREVLQQNIAVTTEIMQTGPTFRATGEERIARCQALLAEVQP